MSSEYKFPLKIRINSLFGEYSKEWIATLLSPTKTSKGLLLDKMTINRLRVVLDLDDCLVCSDKAIGQDSFVLKPGLTTFTIKMEAPYAREIRVHLRPGLHSFLRDASKFTDLYVMTSGRGEYARPTLKAIDPEGIFFKGIISREHFPPRTGKDLRLIGPQFDEKRTVLIDNSENNFIHQPANGILVREFRDDPNDTHLEDVLYLLRRLQFIPDVQTVLRPAYNHANQPIYEFADHIFL